MADSPKTKNVDHSSKQTMWMLVGLAAILLLPVLAAGFALWWLLRGRLGRAHFATLAAAGVVSTIISGGDHVTSYGGWLKALVIGPDRLDIPWLALFTFATVIAGTFGMLIGTKVGAMLPSFLRKQKMGRAEFLPTDRQRSRIERLVTPADDNAAGSLPDAEINGEVGKRRFPIGLGPNGAPFYLSEKEIGVHGMIFGSTGSGKTETLKEIAAGLADLGWDGLILDLKEDTKPGGLRDWVKEYSAFHRVPYQELRLSNPNPEFWFDVLAGLGRDEARDAIMSLTAFDDDYYQQISKKLMGQLLRLMYAAHEIDPVQCPYPTLFDIAQLLSSPSLPNATKKMRAIVAGHLGTDEFGIFKSPQQVEQQQAHSWGAKLGQVFETQAGLTVLRPDAQRPMFDVTKPGLMYVGLDSQGKADLTRLVSSAMLQRLSADSAQRTTGANTSAIRPKFIIVDEANWVDRKIVQNLLSRARSAGIAMFLSTQGPKDWIDKDGDDFGRLGQNVNISIFMRQGDPDSARLCAEYLGMQEFHEQTLQHRDGTVLNSGSVRRETDWRVTPDQLRELLVGEALVRVGVPSPRLSWVKVAMRSPTRPVPGRRELTSISGLTDPVVPGVDGSGDDDEPPAAAAARPTGPTGPMPAGNGWVSAPPPD